MTNLDENCPCRTGPLPSGPQLGCKHS